jgi:hypothetical protein
MCQLKSLRPCRRPETDCSAARGAPGRSCLVLYPVRTARRAPDRRQLDGHKHPRVIAMQTTPTCV